MCSLELHANNLVVAPNGTPHGDGSPTRPYDLVTVLATQVGQPGDTFWVTGGNYQIGHIDTKIQGALGQPITFRAYPGDRASIDGSINFYNSNGFIILRDLEFFSSDTNRVSSQTGAGFNPTDLKLIPGIASYAPNMAFLNLVIHDETRHGIYISQVSSYNTIYGCVIYNNGWQSPDNAEGHGIYEQGSNGGRVIADNIVCNNSGANYHVYENDAGYSLARITLDGNVAFNAGGIQSVRPYRDWVVGVDSPGLSADLIVFKNNMSYRRPSPVQDNVVQLGRQGVNGSVAVMNNYLPTGLETHNWTIAAVTGNTIAADASTGNIINFDQAATGLAASWDANTYQIENSGSPFALDASGLDFATWQQTTGFDLNSWTSTGPFHGTVVFVKPNPYEAGRANIIVYNWDKKPSVDVDISSAVSPGAAYEVRNAADFYGTPVLAGVYQGNPITLPMTNLTVAAPMAPMQSALPTGPTFNVFVLLPRVVQLQISRVQGQAAISWKTNSGNWYLQAASNLSGIVAGLAGWNAVTNMPAVVSNQFQVTTPIQDPIQFFRLQSTR